MSAQYNGGFAEPFAAQAAFAQQYDLENPNHAMTSYQRIMHEHTKQQFEMAAASSRRRSTTPKEPMASLSTSSSTSSVSSTSS